MERFIEDALVDAVRRAARAEILPRFRQLDEAEIASKSSVHDPVTAADIGAEAHLRAAIADILPGALIIGEEGVATDPAELDQVSHPGQVVVLDPVDGTWNFSRGLATFGTLLAVLEGGETVFGLLYDPVGDAWISATAGVGTWQVENGLRRRCRIAPPPPLRDATGLHHGQGLTPEEWAAAAAIYPRIGRVTSTRASIWDYWLLVTGGAAFCLNRYLNVWDHAAGVLALREAGGHAALLTGQAYHPAQREGLLLAASSEALWDEVAGLFGPALGAE
ncbi:MAG: inositol monophosphatase [Pseudomonadota bacterium]